MHALIIAIATDHRSTPLQRKKRAFISQNQVKIKITQANSFNKQSDPIKLRLPQVHTIVLQASSMFPEFVSIDLARARMNLTTRFLSCFACASGATVGEWSSLVGRLVASRHVKTKEVRLFLGGLQIPFHSPQLTFDHINTGLAQRLTDWRLPFETAKVLSTPL